MKKLTILLMTALMWTSCESVKSGNNPSGLLLMPVAPILPALIAPELLSPEDIKNLASFYRNYKIYLQKLEIYKREVL